MGRSSALGAFAQLSISGLDLRSLGHAFLLILTMLAMSEASSGGRQQTIVAMECRSAVCCMVVVLFVDMDALDYVRVMREHNKVQFLP